MSDYHSSEQQNTSLRSSCSSLGSSYLSAFDVPDSSVTYALFSTSVTSTYILGVYNVSCSRVCLLGIYSGFGELGLFTVTCHGYIFCLLIYGYINVCIHT